MKLRVLGCYGGSAPGMSPVCYLVDDALAIDAGALTDALTLAEQARVDHVLLTHAHLDHVATLPFLLDNVFAARERPVTLHGSEHALAVVRRHLFNDELWPDFARLDNGRCTLLAYSVLAPGRALRLAGLEVTPVAMEHGVPCLGYLLRGPTSTVAVCGDTLDVGAMAAALAGVRDLAAIVLEASFPDEEEALARASGHLTPAGFARELRRLPGGVPVYATHLKPACAPVVRRQLEALGEPRLRFLEQGREYAL